MLKLVSAWTSQVSSWVWRGPPPRIPGVQTGISCICVAHGHGHMQTLLAQRCSVVVDWWLVLLVAQDGTAGRGETYCQLHWGWRQNGFWTFGLPVWWYCNGGSPGGLTCESSLSLWCILWILPNTVLRSSRSAYHGSECTKKQYTEVEYVAVITMWLTDYCELQFCLVDVWSSAVYFTNAPSQLFWEEKLGKPKEEIGNLNGFEYMYLSGLKVPYF